MLAGCTATGTGDSLVLLRTAWRDASAALPPPPDDWFLAHRIQLLAALIPQSLHSHITLTGQDANRFLPRFHLALAAAIAERLRRRFAITATAAPADAQDTASRSTGGVSLACPLPPDRQLSPRALRQLEVQRRDQQPPAVITATSGAPPTGEPRQRWLRTQLLAVITSETEPCPTSKGGTAEVFLELFERVTTEPFTDTPGVALTNRIRSLAKVLGNITREVQLQPPLVQSTTGSLVRWNRTPRHRVDVRAWRRSVEERERHSVLPPRQHITMAQVDAGLADWIRNHRFLRPVDPSVGESGMALLLLWEVDHQQPFPTGGRSTRTDTLVGFTRRLKRRIQEDQQLSGWLLSEDIHQPLAPGMYPSHHLRWGVSICAPEPEDPSGGWYAVFRTRWLEFLSEQALGIHVPATRQATTQSTPVNEASSSSSQPVPTTATTRRAAPSSRKRSRHSSPTRPEPAQAQQPEASASNRRRGRTPSTETAEPTPKRRQGDLHQWIATSAEDDHEPHRRRCPGNPRISPPSTDVSDQRHPRRHAAREETAPSRQDGDDPRRTSRQSDLRRWIASPDPAPVVHRASGHSRAEQGPPT